jgi:hypothetical protein
MPFKIADLIYLSAEEFCFVNPPEGMESELRDLEMENIQVVRNKKDCKKDVEVKTICFGRSGCDLNVFGQCYGFECSSSYGKYDYGIVENRDSNTGKVEILYYITPELLYAALFSSPDLYRCNLNRLMHRVNIVSRLYLEKINSLKTQGCRTGKLNEKLSDLALQASYLTKAENIISIKDYARQVDNINTGLICKVF